MTSGRSSRGRRGRSQERDRASSKPAVWPGLSGGLYRPLSESDVARIHEGVLQILARVGLSEVPTSVAEPLLARGAAFNDKGRLTFPIALVEDAIAGFRRGIVLHGRRPGLAMDLSGARVHTGSGGAAPMVLDLGTGRYRDAQLRDLYDAARLVDALDHHHFFSRSLVARDMTDEIDLDVNTAFASLAGTAKHVMVSASQGDHVALIADMVAEIAGSAEAFRAEPFLSFNINHVTPPLRYAAEACEVLEQAALRCLPCQVNTFGQVGASSPASLGGAVMQAVAETLAGMIYAWLIEPDCPLIFGPRPMITDLRTGAMSGGSGEQAVAMAAAVQMGRHYDLATSSIAGATDSKRADAQAGYEKALTVSLAAHAGCNLITQAGGAQASLMGVSFPGYVIDDDMLGSILRSLRGVEVDAMGEVERIIEESVLGEGHFLGAADTYQRMEADFLYPALADRQSIEAWEEAGAPDLEQEAAQKAQRILADHYPIPIDPSVEADLRQRYAIHLPAEVMRPTAGESSSHEE